MTYWREFLLLGLLLAGLEIAVNGVSLVVGEIARALGGGGATVASDHGRVRLAAGLLLVLVASAGLTGAVWLRSARRRIATGKRCPACQGETVRIRRRAPDRLLGKLLDQRLQRRKCPNCGWRGVCAV